MIYGNVKMSCEIEKSKSFNPSIVLEELLEHVGINLTQGLCEELEMK